MWNIDTMRRTYLAIAEAIDAYRVIPRLLLIAYGMLVYKTWMWYTSLEPYVLAECVDVANDVSQCIISAPTTQHAALVTTVVGIAGLVIGAYQASGRKWNGFTPWKKKKEETTDSASE